MTIAVMDASVGDKPYGGCGGRRHVDGHDNIRVEKTDKDAQPGPKLCNHRSPATSDDH